MRWLVVFSFVVALLLSIIPLPFEWRWWRPEFVALLVVYWATYSPEYFGIFSAWVFGLLLDVVELLPLGHHSIGLIIIAYISHLSYQRIRSYVVWQQATWVFVLVGIYQLFCNWTSGFVGKTIEGSDFLITALITAFLWPLLVASLQKMKLRWRLL